MGSRLLRCEDYDPLSRGRHRGSKGRRLHLGIASIILFFAEQLAIMALAIGLRLFVFPRFDSIRTGATTAAIEIRQSNIFVCEALPHAVEVFYRNVREETS